MVSLVLFLTGCSDERQAASIFKKMDEAAEFENNFAVKQKDLNESKKEAQELYQKLIELDINDEETMNDVLEKANILVEKQQKLLKEAEENFQIAYEKFITIEQNIEKIKDEQQKNEATKLLTIMNEKKELIDSYFNYYDENLELQDAFYEHVADQDYDLKTLDEQIIKINEHSNEMEEIIEQYNERTEQYIKVANEYGQVTA